jgi:hypothetical protein
VAVIGHSRGGVLAKALAAARPDLVTLWSPAVARLAWSPLSLGHMAAALALSSGHLPGVGSWRCMSGQCGHRFRRALRAPFPGDVGYVAVYSKTDGFVDWRACQDPAAQLAEIRSSHLGANAMHTVTSARRWPRSRKPTALDEPATAGTRPSCRRPEPRNIRVDARGAEL